MHVGYEMTESQKGESLSWLKSSHIQQAQVEQMFY